jgi:hypothetical protein
MAVEVKPLAEITQDALSVLYKEIGIVNTVRFISQFTVGYGSYTEERAHLFAEMTLDDIIAEIRRGKSSSNRT